jgi:hypothetical protein
MPRNHADFAVVITMSPKSQAEPPPLGCRLTGSPHDPPPHPHRRLNSPPLPHRRLSSSEPTPPNPGFDRLNPR